MAKTEPKAWSREQAQQLYFGELADYVREWARVPGKTPIERCRGLVFSILAMFDGESGTLPGVDLHVSPHESDKEYLRRQGRNWFEPDMVLNPQGELHDRWQEHWQSRRGEEPPSTPRETEAPGAGNSKPSQHPRLGALRREWEKGLETVAETAYDPYGHLVVSRRPGAAPRVSHYCFRYSFVRQWLVSVDRWMVDANEALRWMAANVSVGER